MSLVRGLVRGTVRGLVRGTVRSQSDPLARLSAYWVPNRFSEDGQSMLGHGTASPPDITMGSIAGTVDSSDPLRLPYDREVGGYAYFEGASGVNLTVANPAGSTAEIIVDYADGTSQITYTTAADPIEFGNTDVNFADKKVRRITINDDLGGSVVGLWDGDLAIQSGYTDSYANTFTPNGFVPIVNKLGGTVLYGDGVSQYAEMVSNPVTAIADGADKTILLLACLPSVAKSFKILLSTTNSAGNAGVIMNTDGANPRYRAFVNDGVNATGGNFIIPNTNTPLQVNRVSIRATATEIHYKIDDYSTRVFTRTQGAVPQQIMRLFSQGQATPGNYQQALIYGLAIHDGYLTDDELATMADALKTLNGGHA